MGRSEKITVIIFCLVLAFLFAGNIISADREFSEVENRYLAQPPEFSFESLFSGDFTREFEEYLTDQFFLRDAWVGIKTRAEMALGKKENNGVFFADGGYLIENAGLPNYRRIEDNLRHIEVFAKSSELPLYLMTVPNHVKILEHKLPSFAKSGYQQEMKQFIRENKGENTTLVDVSDILFEKNNEYIYFRTDHHWTARGAYYAYRELMREKGKSYMHKEDFLIETVSDNFLGTMFSRSGVRNIEGDLLEIYKPLESFGYSYTTIIPEKDMVIEGLYDYSFLEEKDKYSIFIGGNNPLTIVKSNADSNERLLVIKDSFAHAMIPFLANHYEQIHIVDLRYYNLDLNVYAENEKIDSVLVLYNMSNFSSDNNLVWLSAYD